MERDDELTAKGGWCAPSDEIFFVDSEIAEQMGLSIPEVQIARGGIDWGETPLVDRKPPVVVERDPSGRWQYGVDVADYEDGDTEPEIVYSEYGDEFRSAQEAYDYGGGKVYKRWVPAPGPWDEVL